MDRRAFLAAAGAAALAPRGLASNLGGTPLALVTADLESRIVAVHAGTGRVVRTIRTLSGPRSIETVGAAALVCHTELGAVSIVDARTLRVRRVLRSFAEPRYCAASPEGRYAYVTDSARGEVVVVDVVASSVVGRVEVGGPARHLSLDLSGRALWTALGTKAQHVAVLDVSVPRRPRLVRRFSPPWLAHDVGFARTGRRVWVTSGSNREIALYDRRSGRIVGRLDAGAPPQHVTFLDGLAYVTSGDDGTLEVRSAVTGRLQRMTRVPVGSYNVQEGWGRILTPSLSRGTLCIADRNGRLVHELRPARSSHDACMSLPVA